MSAISSIKLQQFRSYKQAGFEFGNGVNIVVGPNASGKTNLLEAILLLTRGKSYRARDQELVQHGQAWSRLEAAYGDHSRVVKLEQQADSVKKSFLVEGKPLSRLIGNKLIPAIVFEPNHLLMLSGAPEHRRAFLDDLIEQTVVGYATLLRHYKRTLAQRNSLLKHDPAHAQQQLFAWDVRLSELGAQIVLERRHMLSKINQPLAGLYGELAGRPSPMTVIYSNPVDPGHYASTLLRQLEKDRQLDLARGFTGHGPHREDLLFEFNGRPLASTASRGETRTTLLALKIIELQIIETARAQKPLLLLDDVYSELDSKRRAALTSFLQTHQTFITTTNADAVRHTYRQAVHTIKLPVNAPTTHK